MLGPLSPGRVQEVSCGDSTGHTAFCLCWSMWSGEYGGWFQDRPRSWAWLHRYRSTSRGKIEKGKSSMA